MLQFYYRIVEYKDIKETYITISMDGVIQFNLNKMVFTPIGLWEKEYIHYLTLMKVLFINKLQSQSLCFSLSLFLSLSLSLAPSSSLSFLSFL